MFQIFAYRVPTAWACCEILAVTNTYSRKAVCKIKRANPHTHQSLHPRNFHWWSQNWFPWWNYSIKTLDPSEGANWALIGGGKSCSHSKNYSRHCFPNVNWSVRMWDWSQNLPGSGHPCRAPMFIWGIQQNTDRILLLTHFVMALAPSLAPVVPYWDCLIPHNLPCSSNSWISKLFNPNK